MPRSAEILGPVGVAHPTNPAARTSAAVAAANFVAIVAAIAFVFSTFFYWRPGGAVYPGGGEVVNAAPSGTTLSQAFGQVCTSG